MITSTLELLDVGLIEEKEIEEQKKRKLIKNLNFEKG